MKLKSLPILLLFTLLSLASSMQISKGKVVSIVHGANATETEREAANELQIYISRICGAECPVRSEGEDISGPTIYVGETEYTKRAIPDYAKLGKEEWVIKNVGDDLVLGGGRPRGIIYSVYEFLERLGVVWPNETMEYVPKMDEITVTGLDIREKPYFMLRHVYSGLRGASDSAIRYFVRNKMNRGYPIPAKLGSYVHFGQPAAGHTFHKYSLPEWPDEFFALNEKGQRPRSTSSSGPGQLCLTNPELQKTMVARLREFIKSDRKKLPREDWPVIYVVGMNDNNSKCLCENCKRRAEEEGSYAGPMLDLVNYMANDIAKDYPDIFLRTSAYTWALKAPKHVRPAKNVIIHICKLGCEFSSSSGDTQVDYMHPRNKSYLDNYMEWLKIAEHTDGYDYWIIYTKPCDAPYLNARNICSDMKFYYEHSAMGVSTECEHALSTCFYHLKFWIGLKTMQNPYQDYDVLLDRFCRASYGPAAAPMRALAEYIQERQRQADIPIGRATTIVKRPFSDLTPNPSLPDILPYTDRAFYEKANALLDEAETLAKDYPEYLACVRRERVPIDNALLNTYTKYMDNPPSGKLIAKTYQALYDRNEANYIAQGTYFFTQAYNNKNAYKVFQNDIKLNRLVTYGDKESLPEELRTRKTIVFPWSAIRTCNGSFAADDPDAYGGRTTVLDKRKGNDYYRIPHEMAVHASDLQKKTLCRFALEAKDIPQDEKYHLYHLGRANITPRTLVWIHWTWLLQCNISSAYVPDGDNEWDVYVSIKLTGEPYVKGSKTETGLYCDRVIMAK